MLGVFFLLWLSCCCVLLGILDFTITAFSGRYATYYNNAHRKDRCHYNPGNRLS